MWFAVSDNHAGAHEFTLRQFYEYSRNPLLLWEMQGRILQAHRQTLLQEVYAQMMEKIFPTILMILDFCAAMPYAVQGDVKHTVYWIAAGVLTLSVTWL